MKEKVNDTNLVYLYPTTLLVGLYFAFLSSTGKVKDALKNIAYVVGVVIIFVLIAFLLMK
jgi:hypothetical protein